MNRPTPLRQAFRWSAVGLIVLASLATVAVLGSYYFRPTPEVVEQTIRTAATRQRTDVELPKIPLNEISRAAGIDFRHVSGARGAKLLPETMGGGAGFFDFDNDGDQDLLLVNSMHWPGDEPSATPATTALYENDGTGQFTDISGGSGLDVTTYGMGCAFGDFDGDGLTDVYLTSVGPNFLFRNLGGGKFEDVTASAGVAGAKEDWGTSCGWFDYDRDGDLDLFVCNYVAWSREFDESQSFKLVGNERAYGRPQSFGGTFPLFYENQGDGTFREIAEKAGLWVRNPSTNGPVAKSLGVTFFDFDNDQDLDIVVANDTVPNFLFENRFPEPFREIGMSTGVAFDIDGNARGAMGIDIGAIRNSEATAIAIGNFSNEMTAFYVSPEGDLFFTDEAVSNGLGPQTRLSLTFGVAFLDLDLDGRLDLLTANGHLENEINRVLPSQTYEQEPQFFWNAGRQGVTEYLLLSEVELGDEFFHPIVGRGATYADIDSDGDIDFLLTNLDGEPELFRNEQTLGHHWLRVRLHGTASGREAIGARVEIASNGQIQKRIIMPTRGYLTQSELTATFGLKDATTIERLKVEWPSGRTTELTDVAVDRLLEIQEPASE